MGYRKVYLTIEEEEDIAKVKAWREKEGRGGAAYNAILKEGLRLVLGHELEVRRQKALEAKQSSSSDAARPVRRRRRG